jgi:sugar phosphate isomerase/epimerase
MTAPEFGIFARVFPVGSATQIAGQIAEAGYTVVQLNLSALGLPTIPPADRWAAIDPGEIRSAFEAKGLRLWGLSCSYNMTHPDPTVRSAGTRAAVELISHAPQFGVTAVTLCTGSRNPDRMWAAHPDNASRPAWYDMRAELDILLAATATADVILGVEPEPGNVVRDATTAARLIDELGGDGRRIGVIADAANLLAEHPIAEHRRVLESSFATLASNIACVHAKDLVAWEKTLDGHGIVDYELVGPLWETLPQRPPVIVQDVAPADAARSLDYLVGRFAA